MCGIAGLFNIGSAFADTTQAAATLREMTDSMTHRGPDAGGTWSDPRGLCFLGHRRLSIIDTSDAGRQPMISVDGRWVISFNGEIYNFLELRPKLEAEGMQFRGRTDTEVLLASIAHWGIEGLAKLDGMFAFAAFDRGSGDLILARDPFGEKPLYYMELAGRGFAFSSELQALERIPHFDGEVNVDAMAEVLMFQYIGAPRTIYRHVKKLSPGHWLIVRAGEPIRIGRYFEFQPGASGFDGRPLPELADELEDILVRSIKRRMISDVPLGAFLSGGVDSSTVCALVRRKLGVPLKTFSIGFEGAPESEHEAAEAFARHLGTEHYERILAPNTSDFLRGIGRLLDEPNGDSSCLPTYLLSRFAREQVTVAISGDGGDEMFGGYGRYFATLEEADEHARRRRPGWRAGTAYYSNRILVSTEEHVHELFGFVPEGIAEHLASLRGQLNQSSPPLPCLLRKTDVDNYMPGAVLPKVDRMSMQHSLEVRTPFLNLELARFTERLPCQLLYSENRGKVLLRELAYRYLPRDLIDLPKQGFGIPMSRWGREELLDVASRLLESEDSRLREALGAEAIGRFMKRQRSSGGFSTYQVWALAMLESWLQNHPARLPELRDSSASALRGTDRPPLFVCDLGSGRFAVLEREVKLEGTVSANGHQTEDTTTIEARLLYMMARVDALVSTGTSSGPELLTEPLRLPGWGTGLVADRNSGPDMPFDGATLFFPDSDPSQVVDAAELQRFARLGARSLVFFHPHRYDGTLFRLRIKGRTPWRRLVGAMFRNASRIAHWRLGTCMTRGEKAYETPTLPALDNATDTELSERYMVFEGLNQLPPVPVSHEDIGRLGGGRYSIWEQRCILSSARVRSKWIPYWVIENTPENERLLDFVPEIVPGRLEDPASFIKELSRWLLRAESFWQPHTIKNGDKIVVVTHALPPGGAERQWCYLAIGMKEKGFSVTFVVTGRLQGPNAHYLPLLRAAEIEVIDVSGFGLGRTLRHLPAADSERLRLLTHSLNLFGARLMQFSSLLRELRPTAVFAQLDETNLLAATAGAIAEVPHVVLSFRNYNPSKFSYLATDWFRPCYQAVAGSRRVLLSGNSHAANADYAQWMGIPERRIAWIPNAVDTGALVQVDDEALSRLRMDLKLAEDQPVVLGVFRLSEEKQPMVFIEVLARLHSDFPQLRALIAGTGPLQSDLEARVTTLGLDEAVTLLGRRDDIPSLMSISSVLLLTSSFEGMPNVVMEAQALGIPVVATRVGGVPDCVREGETGLIVESGDIEGLTRACALLLKDHRRRFEMGTAARKFMLKGFSIEAMTNRYFELLGSVQ